MTPVIAVAVLLAIVSGCGSSGSAPDATASVLRADRWTLLSPAPVALTEVAAAAVGGKIWVAGGLRLDGRASALVQVFDPVARRWSNGGPSLPVAVHHAALVADDSALYLIGGYLADGTATDAVWRLQPDSGFWTPAAPLPGPRAAGAAAWDGSRIVYGGGVGPNGVNATVFEFAGGAWHVIGALTKPREHLAATTDGRGGTWFLGGRTGGLASNLGQVDLVDGRLITSLGDVSVPRGGVGAFWSDRYGACLVGGEGPGGTFGDVECMAADGTLSGLPSLEFRRHGIGVATVGGAAYVLLGGWRPGLTVTTTVEGLRLSDGSPSLR